MKWIIGVCVGLVAIVAVIAGVGLLLPEKHRAYESAQFKVGAEQLWQTLIDFSAYPTWRSGVSGVERIADMNGHPVWKEIYKQGEGIPYETVESVPNKRLLRRIADPNLPFGGSWEFILEATPGGVTLTITENGEVYNPVYRFVSRFIMGHAKNIHVYLEDLQAKMAVKGQ